MWVLQETREHDTESPLQPNQEARLDLINPMWHRRFLEMVDWMLASGKSSDDHVQAKDSLSPRPCNVKI